ncbi:hypothetical protein I553_2501 [Mycobacterium xenopi 4042]|uniref:Uncharacterized protein n=1 Tax=Mycobacterium xenopi 4042 TaxID=1299334 RepID=X8CAH2_MYCXE|nr:hypothetical protein I553_2501 [Mycobacterium xenopi 4042]
MRSELLDRWARRRWHGSQLATTSMRCSCGRSSPQAIW